jgi:hypothetical protein
VIVAEEGASGGVGEGGDGVVGRGAPFNRRQHRASGCGERGTFVPVTAVSPIGWRMGIQGWCPQSAGYRDLMTDSLVVKNYTCLRAVINTALI